MHLPHSCLGTRAHAGMPARVLMAETIKTVACAACPTCMSAASQTGQVGTAHAAWSTRHPQLCTTREAARIMQALAGSESAAPCKLQATHSAASPSRLHCPPTHPLEQPLSRLQAPHGEPALHNFTSLPNVLPDPPHAVSLAAKLNQHPSVISDSGSWGVWGRSWDYWAEYRCGQRRCSLCATVTCVARILGQMRVC
jgi:hypothetical protein